jgi:hypothetical protein
VAQEEAEKQGLKGKEAKEIREVKEVKEKEGRRLRVGIRAENGDGSIDGR